jgi:glycosyltransferase involved in cell wall biosynthesis
VLEFHAEEKSYELHTLFGGLERASISRQDMQRALADVLSNISPDCIFVSGWGMEIGQVMQLWALENNIPIVMFSESTAYDEPRVRWKEWIKSQLVKAASSALVGGGPHKEYLSQLGMPTESIFVGHNVVDSSHFSKLSLQTPENLTGSPNAKPYFLACTRFGEKKNLPRLVQAYALYVEKCTEWGAECNDLIIAGDGELRAEIEQTIAYCSVEDKVYILGAVGYDSLPWLYQNCEAFVHASTTEQWGLVVNEAMAAGAPILISRQVGCAPDLVPEGENGFQFDPYSPVRIAEVLWSFSRLSNDKKQELGKRSKSLIADWGPERFASGLRHAVDKAIKDGPKKNTLTARVLLRLLLQRGVS